MEQIMTLSAQEESALPLKIECERFVSNEESIVFVDLKNDVKEVFDILSKQHGFFINEEKYQGDKEVLMIVKEQDELIKVLEILKA